MAVSSQAVKFDQPPDNFAKMRNQGRNKSSFTQVRDPCVELHSSSAVLSSRMHVLCWPVFGML